MGKAVVGGQSIAASEHGSDVSGCCETGDLSRGGGGGSGSGIAYSSDRRRGAGALATFGCREFVPTEVVAMAGITEIPGGSFKYFGVTDLEFGGIIGRGGLEVASKWWQFGFRRGVGVRGCGRLRFEKGRGFLGSGKHCHDVLLNRSGFPVTSVITGDDFGGFVNGRVHQGLENRDIVRREEVAIIELFNLVGDPSCPSGGLLDAVVCIE